MKSKVFRISVFLAVIMVFLAASPYLSFAGNVGKAPQVVKGIIEENRYPEIMVHGRYYNIGSAPIIFRGNVVGASAIERGKWVMLTIQSGQVTNVEIIDRPSAG
jgi:hypothetical protein